RRVDVAVGADVGLRVLLDDGDPDRDADADEAAGEARGDEQELGVVTRREQDVVARDDRDDRVGRLRGDRDVLHRVDPRGVVDVRVGVQRYEVDTDTHTDTGGT